MMQKSIIDTIKEKLQSYPQIRTEQASSNQLTIFASDENGFDIVIYSDAQNGAIYFNGFHYHFDELPLDTLEDTQDALNSIARLALYGMTGQARLKELSKTGKPFKYILQIQRDDGQWMDHGSNGRLFFKYWAKTSVRYLQNHHIPKEDKIL